MSKQVMTNLIAVTLVFFSSVSFGFGSDVSTLNGMPIYTCYTEQSSCLTAVRMKTNNLYKKDKTEYPYAYSMNVQTTELIRYKLSYNSEDFFRPSPIFIRRIGLDAGTRVHWEFFEKAFNDYNLEVGQAVDSFNNSNNYAANSSEKTLPLSFLMSSAYAYADDTSCSDIPYDGTYETASAPDFADDSRLRGVLFDNIGNVAFAHYAIVEVWNGVVSQLNIKIKGQEFGLAALRYPGHWLNFNDGSRLRIRIDAVAWTFKVVPGSIRDCNGNFYEADQELEVGSIFSFTTEASMDHFFQHHNLRNTYDWIGFVWFYCYTPRPGTVECVRMSFN